MSFYYHSSRMELESENLKKSLAQNKERLEWAEEKAARHFDSIVDLLEAPYDDPSRIGPLLIAPLEEEGPLQYWMYPVDGSKLRGLLLGPLHQVSLFSKEAKKIYEGRWGELPVETLTSYCETYVWVAPPQRQGGRQWEVKQPWYLRLFKKITKKGVKSS